MEIQLMDILEAREKRVLRQKQLLQAYPCPLICFTMNIAGPVKTSPLIERGFRFGLDALQQALPDGAVLFREVLYKPTGPEAFLSVQLDAAQLKNLCVSIEEATPLGRLFDMDVLRADGTKLERNKLRGCIVCGAPGRSCAAGRLHPVDRLQEATCGLLKRHFALQLANAAVTSLIDEVKTTPKPGLVDLRNNGSHKDMDPDLFIASAQALQPYFLQCAQIGQDSCHLTPREVFPLLKDAGIQAEADMYRATGGINTHKGAIYTLGILCAAMGRLQVADHEEDVFSLCAGISADAAGDDLKSAPATSAGLQLYRRLGISGIRGEMAQGLPHIRTLALPELRRLQQAGYDRNTAGMITLLRLMTRVQDTNLYHRGGQEGAEFAANAAARLLERSPIPSRKQVEALDDALIARNLSPGGCADLLAATYFLDTQL